jgi:hypothetical protein
LSDLDGHFKASIVKFVHFKITVTCTHRTPNSNIHIMLVSLEIILDCMDGFFVHQRMVSAIKRVEFVSARMSYIVLRGRWCNIIVLNAQHQRKRRVMIQRTVSMRN